MSRDIVADRIKNIIEERTREIGMGYGAGLGGKIHCKSKTYPSGYRKCTKIKGSGCGACPHCGGIVVLDRSRVGSGGEGMRHHKIKRSHSSAGVLAGAGKTSRWIKYVKSYAKKHHQGDYRMALQDPNTSCSYRMKYGLPPK